MYTYFLITLIMLLARIGRTFCSQPLLSGTLQAPGTVVLRNYIVLLPFSLTFATHLRSFLLSCKVIQGLVFCSICKAALQDCWNVLSMNFLEYSWCRSENRFMSLLKYSSKVNQFLWIWNGLWCSERSPPHKINCRDCIVYFFGVYIIQRNCEKLMSLRAKIMAPYSKAGQ
jgi:hypothetical protein